MKKPKSKLMVYAVYNKGFGQKRAEFKGQFLLEADAIDYCNEYPAACLVIHRQAYRPGKEVV